MRPRLLLVAVALILALAAVGALVALRAEPADRAAVAEEIAAGLRCPDCQALSVADSQTPAAIEIRRQIDQQLAAGRTPDEIRAHFVDRYGEWILLAPRSPLAWVLPFVALAAGVAFLAAWLLSGRARESAPPPAALTPASGVAVTARIRSWSPRRLAVGIGGLLAVLTLTGLLLPSGTPASLAQPVVVNQALAEAQAAEQARQETIAEMLARFQADPTDAEALRALADAYLAGGSDDLPRAAAVLLLLINLEPENVEAYVDLAGAYLRAGDLDNAQAATDRLSQIAGETADVAFLRGLLAFQRAEYEAAVEHFDRFLAMAPDDERAPMIRALRAEAAGSLPGG